MHQNPKIQRLFEAILKSIREATALEPMNALEISETLYIGIRLTTDIACNNYVSIQQVNSLEKETTILFENCVKSILSLKRQSLRLQDPELQQKLTKEQIAEQTKELLSNKTMTLDEGIIFAGDLVNTITYMCKENIENQEQIERLESQIMSHIKEKIDLALGAIQVEQNLVTKH